jgi:hypothetical protein
MTRDVRQIAIALGLSRVCTDKGGEVFDTSSDDDVELTAARQNGLDFSDFDGNQIANNCYASLY